MPFQLKDFDWLEGVWHGATAPVQRPDQPSFVMQAQGPSPLSHLSKGGTCSTSTMMDMAAGMTHTLELITQNPLGPQTITRHTDRSW